MKNQKRFAAILLALALVFSLAGCGQAPASQDPATSAESEASASQPASEAPTTEPEAPAQLTDREGKSITRPEQVEKIISMAPAITETLINLGLADKIVAIDSYSLGREGLAADLPTFDMMTPDAERIAALKPDIIFATGMSLAGGEDPFKPITDLGVLMTYIPSPTTLEGIQQDITFLGDITGTSDRAAEIIATMEAEIDDIAQRAQQAAAKEDAAPTVYFEIAPAPAAYSFGSDTFLNEMIELLGADNVLADQQSWVTVSDEVVLEKNPDVIFTNVNYTDDPVGELLAREGWNSVSAIKNKKVFQVDNNATSLPNENIVLGLTQMAKALYPESFE